MLSYFNLSDTLKLHFRSWVPRWLSIVIALVILMPILLLNGAYTGSNIDIAGFLGVISEDINMAYYASAAGMAIAQLFILKTRTLATTKTIIIVVIFVQIVLSLVCALTSYIEILIFCSFFIGFFKAFSMSEVINILMPAFSPSKTRNEFYAKFYPITIGVGQLSLVLTAEFAYRYQWQHMYYFMIVLLFLALLLVVICMQTSKRLIKISFSDIDWLSFFQVSVVIMAIIYVLTYGKTNDWFASNNIIFATVLILVVGWMFIRRQLILAKPFADLSVLKNRNSRVVYLFSLVFMFFASFSILTSSYVNNILKLDSVKANELYLYTLPGLVVGGFISYYWYLKAIRMAWLIFLGFACFTVAIGILYFRIEPMGLYSDMYLPMFFKGVGMLTLFVAFGVYAVEGLPPEKLIPNAFYIITARSVLGPALGSSILTNWLYRLQQKNNMVLSESITTQNPLAVSQYNQSLKTALSQGFGMQDAEKIATNALYAKVQVQSMTVSIKAILGWMLILSIILLVVILLYFFKFKPVKLIKVGRDLH
ncbi:MAG: MFS transporter [Dysgonomonas sp.]